MKKFFALILAVLYLCASTGMVLNIQYCMGKISSVKVDSYSKSPCKCLGSVNTSDCCSSEFKILKLQHVHNAVVPSFSFDAGAQTLSTGIYLVYAALLPAERDHVSIHGPPVASFPSIYIRNCVFRI